MHRFDLDHRKKRNVKQCRHALPHGRTSTAMCLLILVFNIKAGVRERAYLQVRGHSGGISWLAEEIRPLVREHGLAEVQTKQNSHWTNKEEEQQKTNRRRKRE